MDGITILNIIPAFDGIVVAWIALGVAIVSLGLLIATIAAQWDEDLGLIFAITLIISSIVALGCFGSTHTQRYKVFLSDNANIQEFVDRYTIVEQDGRIYTVEEKA